MKRKIALLTLVASTFLGANVLAADYTLRSGDELNIVVAQDPAISSTQNVNTTSYHVRPDGKVSVPYVGEVDASGMTVSEFTTILTQRLSKYYVNPDVSVNVTKLGTVRVYVFGEINKPGAFELTKGHTVMDAIGAANGFNWDTGKKKIYLIRQDNKNQIIPINLNKMLETGDLTENYEMQEGDILYLTKNGRISFSRDIAPLFSAAYTISEINKD
ncbi:polysaccharide biosynthesis/export family protein [Veillonella criceti]|uniref:Polysaccharide export protein Wza n=1 Tax=Veillonella criceti TaxID=103891 RepID=A0A380NMG1_9FIRM|nr:polysaccharide biosynthesis/export family protein [Veillonella criceti]SUP44746.1 polysaccharide export protein Wza [Veillonella criceti]